MNKEINIKIDKNQNRIKDRLYYLFLILLIILIASIGYYCISVLYPEENTKVSLPKTDWKANWIWNSSDSTQENQWLVFRKTFELEKIPKSVLADISVDSRYWLYINGNQVIFEGGLKRGPTSQDSYYETVDITDYLKEGKNTIGVLVWYWGKDQSLSNSDSGQGGFLFEIDSDELSINSDNSWKVQQNVAYQTNEFQPNYRLPEFNIYYNAQNEIGNWIDENYDDSTWENATEYGIGGVSPWNELYPRNIPFLKDYGYKDFLNSGDFLNQTYVEPTEITLQLPYNAQFTPYFKIIAPANKKIDIKTDSTPTSEIFTTYITKEGEQEFESLNWVNGENLIIEIPEGITIQDLKFHETGYNSKQFGYFNCNDDFFNKLWEKSYRTLYVTMRDNYMDCPDRERAQWFGDITTEMNMSFYTLDNNANLLYEKAVDSIINWNEKSSILETTVPSKDIFYEVPLENLAGINGFLTYYNYTGDQDFLERVYEGSKKYLLQWEMDENGLVKHKSGSWDFADWGENADIPVLENAWYYKTLDSVIQMSEILSKKDINELQERKDSIQTNFNNFWTENGFKSESVEIPDDRANAIVVLAGLYDKNDPVQFEAIKNILTNVANSSPYMERYVQDALCEMGLMNEAQDRIKLRYSGMVDYPYSTLWEYWDVNAGTRNHAWSGSPLITMSQYMAGISPGEPGYEVINIKPQLGSLTSIKCQVPTKKGIVNEDINLIDNNLFINLTVPKNSILRINFPNLGCVINDITLNNQSIRNSNDDSIKFIEINSNYEVYEVSSNNETQLNFIVNLSY